MINKKIAFIGAGNMSAAIIRGLVADGYPANLIMATNPSQEKLDILARDCGISVSNDNQAGLSFGEIVVLAVKPQLISDVCASFNFEELNNPCFVSIAAGLPLKRLGELLNHSTNIVRVMPNTPSAIGEGMSGIYAGAGVPQDSVDFIVEMMKKVGDAIVVENESDINTVIAAAGSSPAYFFLIAEAMQNEAMKMGINKSDARRLVQQAMLGSAKMLKSNEGTEAAQLRANVTSKGGTTHQAIVSLQDNNIEDIFAEAMRAAVARANEMANEF
ncbi:pyrroline-5-carboxylate reductase [Agaribacter flavus]|uniref:Pyrroline-5-carboxylate reductase n=1 Tax=Agaribacter flavus TaxID=1902781 RepID=A0ABV7FRB6_9ALTE